MDEQPKASRMVTIVNPQGMHIRAASLLVQTARRFQSQIEVRNHDRRADAKTETLQILTLGAHPGDQIFIEAVGPDAQEAVEAIAHLIESQFEEPTAVSEEAAPPASSRKEKTKKGKGPPSTGD